MTGQPFPILEFDPGPNALISPGDWSTEGCLTVEIKAAGFFAAAKFRGLRAAQLLYAADDVSGGRWAERGWRDRREIRRTLLELCLETIAAI